MYESEMTLKPICLPLHHIKYLFWWNRLLLWGELCAPHLLIFLDLLSYYPAFLYLPLPSIPNPPKQQIVTETTLLCPPTAQHSWCDCPKEGIPLLVPRLCGHAQLACHTLSFTSRQSQSESCGPKLAQLFMGGLKIVKEGREGREKGGRGEGGNNKQKGKKRERNG